MLIAESPHILDKSLTESVPGKDKNIKSLILQYLQETGMQHSAFCFGHEATVTVDKYMTSGRLLSLVEKGIRAEQREKESTGKLAQFSNLPISVNRSIKQFKKKPKISQKFSSTYETLSNKMSLEELISSQVQFQLQKFKLGGPSETSIHSQNQSLNSPTDKAPPIKMHPRRKKNMTYSGFSQLQKEIKPIIKRGKKSVNRSGNKKRIKNSKKRVSMNQSQQEPKSILKNSSRRKFNFAEDSSSFANQKQNPKSRKSITIRDIKSLNCSEIKQTTTEKITSSKLYETEHTIKLTDEVETPSKKDINFLSHRKDSEQVLNEGFSFGGSEKETQETSTPKKPRQSSNRRFEAGTSSLLSRSMYDNGFGNSTRELGLSSGEIINLANYFYRDSGKNFEPYEFRSYENFVIVFDKYLKQICLFNVPLDSAKQEKSLMTSTLSFFSLTESFSKKSPFFTMNKNLIFYTASQFIAFDYRYNSFRFKSQKKTKSSQILPIQTIRKSAKSSFFGVLLHPLFHERDSGFKQNQLPKGPRNPPLFRRVFRNPQQFGLLLQTKQLDHQILHAGFGKAKIQSPDGTRASSSGRVPLDQYAVCHHPE